MIYGSTFSNNTVYNSGGALQNLGGTLGANNSTFSGNSATNGGGALSNNGTLALANVTVSLNSATTGGGVNNNGSASLSDSLIAQNSSPSGPDCAGAYSSGRYNLLGNGAGCSGLLNGVNGDQVGSAGTPINPQLGALQFIGGATQTMALLTGSPAIDTANPACCLSTQGAPLNTDQRGYVRPFPVGGRCDIGAFEYHSVPS